jgi:RimJ/RimL family protein N-acetyltransferase
MNYLLLCTSLILSVTGFALEDTNVAECRLETNRLVVTHVTADSRKFYNSLFDEPSVIYQLDNCTAKELAEAEAKLQQLLRQNGVTVQSDKQDDLNPDEPLVTSSGRKIPLDFVISLKPNQDGKPLNSQSNYVGLVTVAVDTPNNTPNSGHKYAVQLDCIIAPPHRNNGYAFEATASVIDYMTRLQGSDFKIEFFDTFVYSDNISAVKTLKKLGFQIYDKGQDTKNGRTRDFYKMKLSPTKSFGQKAQTFLSDIGSYIKVW